jgi:hypothetical protein
MIWEDCDRKRLRAVVKDWYPEIYPKGVIKTTRDLRVVLVPV